MKDGGHRRDRRILDSSEYPLSSDADLRLAPNTDVDGDCSQTTGKHAPACDQTALHRPADHCAGRYQFHQNQMPSAQRQHRHHAQYESATLVSQQ
jgi:hypothetical protein